MEVDGKLDLLIGGFGLVGVFRGAAATVVATEGARYGRGQAVAMMMVWIVMGKGVFGWVGVWN